MTEQDKAFIKHHLQRMVDREEYINKRAKEALEALSTAKRIVQEVSELLANIESNARAGETSNLVRDLEDVQVILSLLASTKT